MPTLRRKEPASINIQHPGSSALVSEGRHPAWDLIHQPFVLLGSEPTRQQTERQIKARPWGSITPSSCKELLRGRIPAP